MAEPPHKRARRPNSKQMWDESDQRAPVPSRERDDRRDDRDRGGRRDDRDRDRDRKYRSRSPRESRDGRGGRGQGSRRDERNGHARKEDDRTGKRRDEEKRGAGRARNDRESARDMRDKPRERSRDRRRSRSPRRDREERRDAPKEAGKPVLRPAEEDLIESRASTPPVSFKVGRATSNDEAQDHDRMDTDEDAKQSKTKGPRSKKGKVPEPEEDEEIIVEDDGMAAMQAMMGFGGFGTTQNKKVLGNDVSAVRKEKKTEYRQYMNRVGGFNRPLSPSHE